MSLTPAILGPVEPVSRYRRGPTTTDAAGDQHAGAWLPAVPFSDGVVWVEPGKATEDRTGAYSLQSDLATLYGPDDLDLTAADEVGWRDERWQVDGDPQVFPDPLATGVGSTVVQLKLRKG